MGEKRKRDLEGNLPSRLRGDLEARAVSPMKSLARFPSSTRGDLSPTPQRIPILWIDQPPFHPASVRSRVPSPAVLAFSFPFQRAAGFFL